MRFFYGGYVHESSEVNFSAISRVVQFSATHRANILQETWSMYGKIVKQGANSQSDIFTALANMKLAYSVNGYSAGMLDNNGNRTPFFFDNSRAIGGVIVLNPISHEQMQGAESVTYLRFTFQLQMDSFLSSPFDILEYSEQLQFSDNQGLPLQVARVPIYGQPIIQNVSTASFYYATQSGTAKLRTPNPNPEPPLFPNSFSGEDGSRQVAYTSPKIIRGVPVEYGVNWSYRFRSATPLFSSVNARG